MMDNSSSRNYDHLGVNKMGKYIRKSPLHQPNLGNSSTNSNTNTNTNTSARQQPQAHVYNISKTEFRDIVQQLTGANSQEPLHQPPQQKPQSMRLQKIRPPPLAPFIQRPPMPPPPAHVPPPVPCESFNRPAQFVQPGNPGASFVPNNTESPVTVYMRYLESLMTNPTPKENQISHEQQPSMAGQTAPMPNFPSPRTNSPALFPSPSQLPFPSPGGFMNLLSPLSPYPLISPGMQFPPPLTPIFSFSPIAQPGIVGPSSQPPPSPGFRTPLSPSGFFAIPSPKWRNQ